MSQTDYADLYALTPDGLRLHWRDYGDFKNPRLPGGAFTGPLLPTNCSMMAFLGLHRWTSSLDFIARGDMPKSYQRPQL